MSTKLHRQSSTVRFEYLHDLCGVAGDEDVRWDIAPNDGACGDNGVLADTTGTDDDCSCPNPDTGFDEDIPAVGNDRIVTFSAGLHVIVLARNELAELRDTNMRSDMNISAREIEVRVVDPCTIGDMQSTDISEVGWRIEFAITKRLVIHLER